MEEFDYTLDYETLDLRERPELYRIGRGEQGVLLVEPYKSEILPYWRFKDPEAAKTSSDAIYALFLGYLRGGDFVGADMARKFLQMGYTRARRYANYPGGKKYIGAVPKGKEGRSGAHGRPAREKGTGDPLKAESAAIFKECWDRARGNPVYLGLRQKFIKDHYPTGP